MPRNGSGVYTLPQAAFVAGTVISSAAVNSDFSDIATALTGSLPRDGQAGMTGQMKTVDGSNTSPGYSYNNETNTGFLRAGTGSIGVSIQGTQIGTFTSTGWSGAVTGFVPFVPGVVCDYAGATAPTYWLLCYGQNISRTTYSALFSAIGTTYGSGDGSTTFGLPDLRGLVTFGKANMGGSATSKLTSTFYAADPTILGNLGGSQYHVMNTSELVAHFHTASIFDQGHSHTTQIPGSSGNTGGGGAFGNNPIGANTGTSATGVRVNSSNGLDTVNTTGGSSPFAIVNPGIIFNKIIYAGV